MYAEKTFSLHMHAKPSFAHRFQTAKMASSRTSAQNNGPRAQKRPLGVKLSPLGVTCFNRAQNAVKCLTHGLRGFNVAVLRRLAMLTVTMLMSSC